MCFDFEVNCPFELQIIIAAGVIPSPQPPSENCVHIFLPSIHSIIFGILSLYEGPDLSLRCLIHHQLNLAKVK